MLDNNFTNNQRKDFSKDLNNILLYIDNVILKENPSLQINISHILLAILENEDSIANRIMDLCLSEIALDSIRGTYYTIIKNNSLIAVKPNRTVSTSNEVLQLFENAEVERKNLSSKEINTAHIMLALLNPENSFEKMTKVFSAAGLTYHIFLYKLIAETNESKESKETNISPIDMDKTPKIVKNPFLGPNEDNMVFYGGPSLKNELKKKRSKTPMIDTYCVNLNKLAQKGKIDPIIGREKEYENLTYILNKRKKNNVVVIGAEGCGKTALCEGLAYLIHSGNCPYSLKNKIVIKADVQSMIAGAQYRGMFEERVKDLFEELKRNDEYILFIDDIHSTMKKDNDTNTDIIPLMTELLDGGEVQVIVTTSYKGYHNCFDTNPNLSRKFQKLQLSTPTTDETKKIIKGLISKYEKFHMVEYTDEIIDQCILLSKKYITERNLPDSAIDVIDEVGAMVSPKNTESDEHKKLIEELNSILEYKAKAIDDNDFEQVDYFSNLAIAQKKEIEKLDNKLNQEKAKINTDNILKVISNKTGIPLNNLSINDKHYLSKINERIKKVVIGQDEAVDQICRAVKRKRIGISNSKSTSMMLIGGTGVGKTLIAKTLAKELFGDEKEIVRIDMSEYSDKTAVNKLIGSNPGYVGYQEGGLLTEAVKKKKNCVLLLDEIEKADKDIYNIFLQVFDEGFLTDNSGQKVDFKNVVILMTSNIGAKATIEFGRGIGFTTNENENKKKILDKELKKKFPPEFINRLDSIIYFNQLTDDNLKEIVKIEIDKSVDRIKEAGYTLQYTDDVVDKLFETIKKEKEYGARPIIRAIQNEIENPLTDIILDNEIEKEIYRAIVEDEKIKVL